MSDPFLGQIEAFGFNFAPIGWMLCNGQLLPISQYTALFALLGTTYGGDGQVSFALPNCQSRVMVGQGQARSGSTYNIGEIAGAENVSLTVGQLAGHVHQGAATMYGTNTPGNSPTPGGQVWAADNSETTYKSVPTTTGPMGATVTATLTAAGSSQPHDNIQPCLCLNFCIAVEGVFPSRN